MNWTREQLLLALNLYFRTPFGKQHTTHPPIVALADKIGRTPGAVAMKLNNFTSLDPAEKERGIAGLSGASKADRAIWMEFATNRNELAPESEILLESHFPNDTMTTDLAPPPRGATEGVSLQKTRLQQRYFRRAVLASYEGQCCISGLPVATLLRASHIVPWSESAAHRLDPRNGLCLAATYDAAFDQGLISFSDDLRLLLGDQINGHSEHDEIKTLFIDRRDRQMRAPVKNLPAPEFLAHHRNRWGFDEQIA